MYVYVIFRVSSHCVCVLYCLLCVCVLCCMSALHRCVVMGDSNYVYAVCGRMIVIFI